MATTHYLTRRGAAQLTRELRHLVEAERPKVVGEVAEAAAQGDRSENAEYIYGKKRLREIDRRIRYLTKRLESAEVVDTIERKDGRVYFGAYVDVEDEEGERRTYQIVGPDEAEPAKGRVSYQAPLGRSLMRREVGDSVVVKRPLGDVEIEILAMRYHSDAAEEDARQAAKARGQGASGG
jgi:transcription elongation factor GreB